MVQFDITKDKLDYDFSYNASETNNLKNLFSEIRDNKTLTINNLRRVSLWKIDRVLEISEKLIKKLDYLAKDKSANIFDDNIKKIIVNLTNSNGVGFPMASAILKFLRPDIFPIIDIRSYRAIFNKKLYSSQYSIDVYYNYVKEIYLIRDKLKLPLDKIDEQLYEFDKKHNGKI
jgi:hypothetical protein|tara:strand:- start:90 stop:611 length:522 start_codon:yes stop_codon:yes gene_type:complete